MVPYLHGRAAGQLAAVCDSTLHDDSGGGACLLWDDGRAGSAGDDFGVDPDAGHLADAAAVGRGVGRDGLYVLRGARRQRAGHLGVAAGIGPVGADHLRVGQHLREMETQPPTGTAADGVVLGDGRLAAVAAAVFALRHSRRWNWADQRSRKIGRWRSPRW